MALSKCCDVYGTSFNVETYHIAVVKNGENGDVPIVSHKVDLCPRAFKRFQAKIESAVTPPPPRKGKEDGCD